ncbi:MAG: hypothetical protein JSW54_11060, partial [Fidelibacterota bacterium]
MKKPQNLPPKEPQKSPKPTEKPEKSKAARKEKKAGPSRFTRAFNTIRHRLFLVFLAAAIVFAAAVAGAVITHEVQRDVWEKKLHQKEQEQLIDKRVELMEQTIALMSRGKVVKEMDDEYKKTTLSSLAKVGLDPT